MTILLVVAALPAGAQSGAFCVGDCDGDGAVTVNELVTGVNMVLESAPLSACPALNFQEDTVITIDELLLAVDAALSGCPAGSTPELLASRPAAGARDVPRSEWIRLVYASAVEVSALRGFDLACDGVAQEVTMSALAPDTLVANPAGDLPADVECVLTWHGPDRIESLSFTTAIAGAPATVLYDRTGNRQTVPFPDDLWLAPDATKPNGFRLAVPIPSEPVDVRGIVRALATETTRLDGFSPIAHAVIELSDAPDPATLPRSAVESLDPLATVGVFDLTHGSMTFGRRITCRLALRASIRRRAARCCPTSAPSRMRMRAF